MFQIDFDTYPKLLLQFEKLRKPKNIALIRAFMEPIKMIYDELTEFEDNMRVELAYNCQIGIMELMLNRHFEFDYDLSTRDDDIIAESIISIDNTFNDLPKSYLYRDVDEKEDFIIRRDADVDNEAWIFRDADFESSYHFIVKCPASIVLDEAKLNEVKELVNKVNKGSRRYIVENY